MLHTSRICAIVATSSGTGWFSPHYRYEFGSFKHIPVNQHSMAENLESCNRKVHSYASTRRMVHNHVPHVSSLLNNKTARVVFCYFDGW